MHWEWWKREEMRYAQLLQLVRKDLSAGACSWLQVHEQNHQCVWCTCAPTLSWCWIEMFRQAPAWAGHLSRPRRDYQKRKHIQCNHPHHVWPCTRRVLVWNYRQAHHPSVPILHISWSRLSFLRNQKNWRISGFHQEHQMRWTNASTWYDRRPSGLPWSHIS